MEAGKGAIISCEFIFKCPFTWDRLKETDREEIRYCSQCDREVYLVETEEALQAHAVQGHCVAVSFTQPKEKGEEEESIPMGVGMIKSPYGSTLRDEGDSSRSEMENGLGESMTAKSMKGTVRLGTEKGLKLVHPVTIYSIKGSNGLMLDYRVTKGFRLRLVNRRQS